MTIILDRQVMLVNPWGENIAQFWIVTNDAYDQKWVHCFPYASMHEMMRHDISNQVLVMDGMQMPDLSFLGYIAQVARVTQQLPAWQYEMRSMSGDYHRVLLRQGMSAKEISDLTGFDLQKVKDYYRDYFVVNTE